MGGEYVENPEKTFTILYCLYTEIPALLNTLKTYLSQI